MWLMMHAFWSNFLYSTSIDFFRKGDTRTDRLTIKANWEHCNLSAYHAVTLFYHAFIAVYGTLLLALSIGEVTVGDALPIIAAGLG